MYGRDPDDKQRIWREAFHVVFLLAEDTVAQNRLGYLRCDIRFPVPDDQGIRKVM
jgi:hypothetical protein